MICKYITKRHWLRQCRFPSLPRAVLQFLRLHVLWVGIMKSSLKFVLTLLPFVLISGFIVFKDDFPEYTSNNGLVEEAIIPDGWHPHPFGTSTLMFTRSRFLKRLEGTESYAYGEQIVVDVNPYDSELNKEEDWYQLEWTNRPDEYGNLDKKWSTQRGYKVLRLMTDGMTGAGDLHYIIFAGDTVHTISLYPAYNSPHLETFEAFFQKYLESLDVSMR